MDCRVPVGDILQLIEELGSASLQSVAAELGHADTYDDVAVAFKMALSEELIEPHERGPASRGLRYRLTARGLRALSDLRPAFADIASL
jgi:hypothetical protein